ncbi:PDZ domain-containing protein, partial [Patescibacteria group bacterium]|nr:PDZ domain-containing protein [Patescibacteria group bacterium]
MNQPNLGGSIPPQPIRKRSFLHLGRRNTLLRRSHGIRNGMGSIPRSASAVLGILLVFFGGIFIGRYLIPAAELSVDLPRFIAAQDGNRQLVFPTFWEAWDKLHAKYIGDISEEALFYGAVSGMIKAAGDPYTAFAEPAETERFEETIEGSFSGVGIEIGLRSGLITVIAPLNGSTAEQVGIREGDIIIKVDEEELESGTNLDEVVSLIRGEKGTTVTLTVVHKDARETTDIDIVRDTIEIESVKVTTEDGIAHLILTSFNGETTTQFNTAARQMVKDDVRGIILDLRNNPGGFLKTSVELASRFLPKDTLVVTERGKKSTEYRAEGNPLLAAIPYVV